LDDTPRLQQSLLQLGPGDRVLRLDTRCSPHTTLFLDSLLRRDGETAQTLWTDQTNRPIELRVYTLSGPLDLRVSVPIFAASDTRSAQASPKPAVSPSGPGTAEVDQPGS
ncbi:MAG: hypothetical protein KDK91_11095, partial [Gammaproteobacteria bacterium]|nr:hypothetical protein [Gammaproteobacteria bacterium]